MDNTSYIFWFSGTGNSFYAAKRLAAGLGKPELVHMTDETPAGAVGGKGAKIGFVFPSYYGNLPRAVRSFVERLEIKPDTYIFTVVTMGGVGQGSVAALDKALQAKGLRLNYGKCVRMPANYVIKYDPADLGKSRKTLEKADSRLQKFASEIASGMNSIKKLPITAMNLYKDVEVLDAGFSVTRACNGCGQCEKICPVRNIRMNDGKPVWLHHCEHCVACISWCPVEAIEYGGLTQTRRRYKNPLIKINELIR